MSQSGDFNLLKTELKRKSTRPFLARGKSVMRCEYCQLGKLVCICSWKCALSVESLTLVLLMHHDEVFKPTNTGRLIADILPKQTYVFEWSRTEPDAQLLELLKNPNYFPVILYPGEADEARVVYAQIPESLDKRKLLVILLDGTWKQAGKMYRTSQWLNGIPLLRFDRLTQGQYLVRQAIRPGQLSTAEAAAEILKMCGEMTAAEVLLDYFTVFNEHYLATRGSRGANILPAHERLTNFINNQIIK